MNGNRLYIISANYKLGSSFIKSSSSLQAVETGKETINSWNTDKLPHNKTIVNFDCMAHLYKAVKTITRRCYFIYTNDSWRGASPAIKASVINMVVYRQRCLKKDEANTT